MFCADYRLDIDYTDKEQGIGDRGNGNPVKLSPSLKLRRTGRNGTGEARIGYG